MACAEFFKLMKFLNQKFKRVRPLLGTFVEIELAGNANETSMQQWITSGFKAIDEIEALMSRHQPHNDLSRLNAAQPNVWVKIHPHTVNVLKACNGFHRDSMGVFDIRCGSAARVLVAEGGMRASIELAGNRTKKTGPWTFDLGGIAKGYAVDVAVETIQRLSRGSAVSGIVNAGGDLRRWGKNWPAVAVATSAVRTSKNSDFLSPAQHVQMPSGEKFIKASAVSVISKCCLWSDALTKVFLMAPKHVADRCLKLYGAHGLVLA